MPALNTFFCLAPLRLSLLTLLFSPLALSHPHSWIDMKTEIQGSNSIEGLKVSWSFDQMASAQMLYSLDANGGQTEENLLQLAKSIVANVEPKGYFSHLKSGSEHASWKNATDVSLQHKRGIVTLNFYLPLQDPMPLDQPAELTVFEPTHYVDMAWPDATSIVLSPDLASQCQLKLLQPQPSPEQLEYATNLAEDETPDEPIGEIFTQKASLDCQP